MATQLIHSVRRSLVQPRHAAFLYYALLVLLADAALCQLIIRRVAFTEIDFATYLEQAALVFHKGERDYAKIRGDSGPLVYPAGHVAVFGAFHWLTKGGAGLWMAQQAFAIFYSVTQAVVMLLFYRADMPAWSLALLPLSKRLHSIYVLRCFNDPVAMLFLYAAVLASTYKKWTPTALLFSAALSIKMNILYFLPAFVYLCTLDQGFLGACRHLATVVLSQILISLPFTTRNAHSYALNAYNFQRAFLYEWTVNWRFLSSDVFLSPRFWLALLLAHIALLVNFFRKWCEPHGGAFRVLVRTFGGLGLPAALSRDRVNASYMASVWFSANLIGILCARSLHYQFYSWYAWQAIFLAVKSPYPFVFKLALLGALEYSWNVFPSTEISSFILFTVHALLLFGTVASRDFWCYRRRAKVDHKKKNT